MHLGRFITFEGGEGSGKSTQIKRLEAHLHKLSQPVIVTREPGGSPNAEVLRKVITDRSPAQPWHPMAEALVMNAARVEHIENVIAPALDNGRWVLCDRFTLSTLAYQGAGGGIKMDVLNRLHSLCIGLRPDMTIILDIDPSVGLQRAFARNEQSRFEGKPIEYHQAIRECYLGQGMHPGNVIIDASGSVDEVARQVRVAVNARFGVPVEVQEIDE